MYIRLRANTQAPPHHVVASVEVRRQLGVELRPAGLAARALTQRPVLLLVSHSISQARLAVLRATH